MIIAFMGVLKKKQRYPSFNNLMRIFKVVSVYLENDKQLSLDSSKHNVIIYYRMEMLSLIQWYCVAVCKLCEWEGRLITVTIAVRSPEAIKTSHHMFSQLHTPFPMSANVNTLMSRQTVAHNHCKMKKNAHHFSPYQLKVYQRKRVLKTAVLSFTF